MAKYRHLPRPSLSSVILLWVLASWISIVPPPALSQNRVILDDEAQKSEIITEVARLLEANYVFPDRAGAFAQALLARHSEGEYARYTDGTEFAEAVTADLREITGDAHMFFRVIEPSDLSESTDSPLHHPIRLSRLGEDEHLGFSKLEWLPGHVGYLELRRFYPISESKEMVDAAMEFLSSANAVIIDLRENRGGAGEALPYFCSFFLPHPTQLTSYYSRENDFLKEFWTLEEVEGGPLAGVPLFLLTSPRTFSASEMLAYDMKVLGRATLVGEPTGGGANSVGLFQVGSDFEIYISTNRAVNPLTDSNWEGVGVIPHISVPEDQALDTAAELAREAAQEHSSAREATIEIAIGKMEGLLARAESLFGAGEDLDAVDILDSLFVAGEKVGFTTEFFMDLLSYNYYAEADGQILLAILRKKAELFPSSEAHESLGNAHRMLGETPEALWHYGKALELDPANRNVAKWIERLRAAQELSSRIDAYLRAQVVANGIPGLTAAVVRDGTVLYEGAFGVRRLGSDAELTPDHVFHFASVSKPFVATAIAQLAEQGNLGLEDRVTEHLPYFRLADDRYRSITIRQMLNHTSGMVDVLNYEWGSPEYDEGAAERFVREMATDGMLWAPGGGWRYSNKAFDALGDLIAKVSGLSFEEYVQKHILDPIGMRESSFIYPEINEDLRTSGHVGTPPRVSDVYPYNRRHAPSSTLNSSVRQMVNWMLVNLGRGELNGRRILARESYDLLWGPTTDTARDGLRVGLSWFLSDYEGHSVVSHGGGDTGFRSYILLMPDDGIGVVIASNWSGTDTDAMAHEIAHLVLAAR